MKMFDTLILTILYVTDKFFSKKRKAKTNELYESHKGLRIGNFSHPKSKKEYQTAYGIVCGYGNKDVIVKLTNCKGWDRKEIMNKSKMDIFIEEKSKGHTNGYWFVSKKELIELSIIYNT